MLRSDEICDEGLFHGINTAIGWLGVRPAGSCGAPCVQRRARTLDGVAESARVIRERYARGSASDDVSDAIMTFPQSQKHEREQSVTHRAPLAE